MRDRRLIALPLLLLVAASSLNGQVDTFAESWRWARFDVHDGLPSKSITDLIETPGGQVWVGTEAGLAWYDGYFWHAVGPDQGLPAKRPSSMAVLGSKDLVVVVDGRLYQGGETGFKPVLPIDGVAIRGVGSAVPISSERLLLNAEGVLYEYSDGILHPFRSRSDAPMDHLFGLWKTRAGSVWMNTSKGLYRLQDGDWALALSTVPLPCLINVLTEDPRGGGLLTVVAPRSAMGLWEWQGASLPKLAYGADVLFQAADTGPDGEAVAVDLSGGVSFRQGGKWSLLPQAPSQLAHATVLRFRHNGDLWIGTVNGLHLFRRSSTRWRHWDGGFGRDRIAANEIIRASDGSIWMGTHHGVAVERQGKNITWAPPISGNTQIAVTGLNQDDQGQIWISSGRDFDGAYRLEGSRWRHFGVSEGLAAGRIHKIQKDRRGRLWFLGEPRQPQRSPGGTPGAGVFIYSKGRFARWENDQGLPDAKVYCVGEGEDGAFWFGTAAGLSRWRAGKWTHWYIGKQLRGEVFTLAIDRRNRVWFAGRAAGLGLLENDRLRFLRTSEGLLSEQIWDMKFDSRQWLWLGTHAGLCCYRDGNWSRFITGLTNLNLWPVLPLEDRVYIGTAAGLSVLSLDESRLPGPKVSFFPAAIVGDSVQLRWRAAAYWGQVPAEDLDAQYRLDDRKWSGWSDGREAAFLDLAPGPHLFHVRVKGLFGDVDQAGQSLTFQIPYPLYRQPFFFVPLGFLLMALLVLRWVYLSRQKRDQLELRRSEERFRRVVEGAPEGIYVQTDGRFRYLNSAALAMFGIDDPTPLLDQPITERIHPDYRSFVAERIRMLKEERRPVPPLQEQYIRLDGTAFDVEVVAVPLTFEGRDGAIVFFRDTTARKLAEQERARLEEQFRQAQKMESVGRLAGGVAHDFNNLLMIINGYAEFLLKALKPGDPLRSHAEHIQKAGQRAASLTQQLLAFSRKQIVEFKLVDLNALIADAVKMLPRLLGEDVEFVTRLTSTSALILADPNQLHQVLMNLVLNARDAMPGGGRLLIETATVDPDGLSAPEDVPVMPGPYVRMAVSDTGMGMDQETLKNIFEPFFTTKEQGKGTGLGLSTVYGVVRQSGGWINVQSKPGKGTTFEVYLPRAEGVPAVEEAAPSTATAAGGSETVLVVEDQVEVRKLVLTVLKREGYRLLEAGGGDKALLVAGQHPGPIHLLVTDVVMPGMTGRELAAVLTARRPEMKVLYMSGYAEDVIAHRGVLENGVAFMQKPFPPDKLTQEVRKLLGPPAAPPN